MAVYTVHDRRRAKSDDDASRIPQRFAFVRDGFHFWAFLLAPFWMLRHRLWLELIVYLLLVGGAISSRWQRLGVAESAAACGRAVRWRCWSGSRRRRCGAGRSRGAAASSVGVVVGDDLEDGRAALLRRLVPASRALPPRRRRQRPRRFGAVRRRRLSDVIGLFPAAGGAAMTVAIVDYGSGNLHSAAKAFERAARESGHDQPIVVTSDPDKVRAADRVVLPGVGAFADCRRGLDAVPGMVEALNETVRDERPAVPRHLCRHAADGGARPRI